MSKNSYIYEIPTAFCGHKLSYFLKSKYYPEKLLAALRQDAASLRLNGQVVHMNMIIPPIAANILTVIFKEDCVSEKVLPVKLPLDIVYEDDDILVINKPAGMPIHPSRQNFEHTLGNAVAYYYETMNEEHTFRCINRLDKDTSGLTIIAKNRISAAILYEQMQRREIYREYTALVEGTLIGNGTIDLPIGKTDENGSIRRFVDPVNGKRAITHYSSTPLNNGMSLVKLHLDTGRTHQIRVHMTHIGYPLIGDRLYNPANTLLPGQALHAGHLRFRHPHTGEELSFTQAPPYEYLLL